MSDISSDEIAGRGVTVTIKYGKGYEEPWLIFRGLPSEVRADIEAAFGYEPGGSEGLSLAQLVLNVASDANAMQVLATQLGATAIPSAKKADDRGINGDSGDSQEAQGDVFAAARAAAAQDKPAPKPHQALYDTIESISDVNDLKRLWAENQGPFTDDAELTAAWKAKGKALKAAAK